MSYYQTAVFAKARTLIRLCENANLFVHVSDVDLRSAFHELAAALHALDTESKMPASPVPDRSLEAQNADLTKAVDKLFDTVGALNRVNQMLFESNEGLRSEVDRLRCGQVLAR